MKNLNAKPEPSFGSIARRLSLALLGAAVAGTAPAAPGSEDIGDKAVRVVTPDRPSAKALDVTLEPLKDSYRVGEPIRFRVTGNRSFYLYLYAVDGKTGEATVLLPNKRQTGNKYPANRALTVPNREIQFYADAPGRDRVVMVASDKYLDVDTAGLQAVGDLTAGKAKDLEDMFEAKGIHIRSNPGAQRSDDVIVRELALRIVDDEPTKGDSDAQSNPTAATPFVTTAHAEYREGDKLTVLFGADRSGYVHVYAIEPGGSYSLLAKRKVDGKRIEAITARAEAPLGRYSLVAAYSEDGELDEALLDGVRNDGSGKSLTLVEPTADGVLAVKQIRVVP